MAWWIWCIVGLVLLGSEMLTPGLFILFFFGFGAILVSFFTALGLTSSDTSQWLFFSVFSIITLLLLRQKLKRGLLGNPPRSDVDGLEGTTAVARTALLPGHKGQVEQRGTTWSAQNRSSEEIREGESCRVVEVNGLTLVVEKIS